MTVGGGFEVILRGGPRWKALQVPKVKANQEAGGRRDSDCSTETALGALPAEC